MAVEPVDCITCGPSFCDLLLLTSAFVVIACRVGRSVCIYDVFEHLKALPSPDKQHMLKSQSLTFHFHECVTSSESFKEAFTTFLHACFYLHEGFNG